MDFGTEIGLGFRFIVIFPLMVDRIWGVHGDLTMALGESIFYLLKRN